MSGKITYDETTGEIFLKDPPESGNKHAIWYQADTPPTPSVTPSISVTPTPTPSAAASFDDWFLPSLDELDQLYQNIGSSEYGDIEIWSSSDYAGVNAFAYAIDFTDGSQSFTNLKSGSKAVVPVRSFTDSPGAYIVGDTGPAGGWIFYIDGTTTYYEAYDGTYTNTNWGNVDTPVATGTAIGTGQSNTTAILGTSGSWIGTAAWACDNYST
jgi:hypothetical protein